jgi:glutathione S-transferase
MFFEQYDHEPAIAVARFLIGYSQLPREQYEKRLPRLWENGAKALGAMDEHLIGREWFVGDSFTLADIALYAYTHVAEEGGFELGAYPSIRAWVERVAAEPGHLTISA